MYGNKNIKIMRTDYGFECLFTMENSRLNLQEFFGYNMVDVLYEVHKEDLFAGIQKEVKYEDPNYPDIGVAHCSLIFYHLFKDLGLPQFYLNTKIKMDKQSDKTLFHCDILQDITSQPMWDNTSTKNVVNIPITDLNVDCVFESPHKSNVQARCYFRPDFNLPKSHERVFVMIFKKLFLKTKQFIESVI